MGLTTNPDDPRLGRGVDTAPRPQNEVYLVLSEEERAKGFVRPYRDSYQHVGPPGPIHALADLTPEQQERYRDVGYVKFEAYPPGSPESNGGNTTGRFWMQSQLNAVGKCCRTVTTMGRALSETYAREPGFYGSTYCVGCSMHLPVNEFIWTKDGERVGS